MSHTDRQVHPDLQERLAITRNNPHLDRIRTIGQEMTHLGNILSLLSWDQETCMPEAALEERAAQQAWVATELHRRSSSVDLGNALAALGVSRETPLGKGSNGFSWQEERLLRRVWRTWYRASLLPAGLVASLSETASLAQAAWVKARQDNRFADFRPWLEKLVDLKAQEAGYVDPSSPAYRVLLDEYEPGMEPGTIKGVFDRLAAGITPLRQAILEAKYPDPLAGRTWDLAGQQALGQEVIRAMGYGAGFGRVDLSAHPFSISLGRKDARITTRYSQSDLFMGLSGLIHETGHALYELGAFPELDSMLLGGSSLGIHESQSRTWENLVGRSQPFMEYLLPRLGQHFPKALAGLDVPTLYRGVNHVKASHIRVDADELSYSLHVILRFNLEQQLMEEGLKVADLPEAWAEESRRLMGTLPPSDREGVLQDIHWSMGSIGYFPTYALGNLYGAMFHQAARKDLPDLDRQIAAGEFLGLRSWLGDHIHGWASAMTPPELLLEVCGTSLDAEPFLAYLDGKFRALYGL